MCMMIVCVFMSQRLGLPTSQEAEADAILQKAMYAPGSGLSTSHLIICIFSFVCDYNYFCLLIQEVLF